MIEFLLLCNEVLTLCLLLLAYVSKVNLDVMAHVLPGASNRKWNLLSDK